MIAQQRTSNDSRESLPGSRRGSRSVGDSYSSSSSRSVRDSINGKPKASVSSVRLARSPDGVVPPSLPQWLAGFCTTFRPKRTCRLCVNRPSGLVAVALLLWLSLPGAAEAGDADARDARNSAALVIVSLQPVACVDEREVRVADVAAIDGGDAALRERIAQLDLADPPRPGQAVQVSREQIGFRIRIAGIDQRRFRLQGAQAARVTLGTCAVPEQEIVDAARQLVLSRLPGDPDDVAIEVARPIRGPVRVPGSKGNVRLDAELRWPQSPLGKVRVDVAISAGGTRKLVVPVDLNVRLYQNIAVSTRAIERGRPITEDMVRFDRRSIDNLSSYLTASDGPVGQRAKRPIAAGQALTKADLEPVPSETPPVVKQRDAVQLVARAGGLRVTAAGEALQDGRPGETIRVRNVDSKIIVLGRVVDRSVVEVLR